MAGIEFGILNLQCLLRRIDDINDLHRAAQAWEAERNEAKTKTNWQFTAKGARIKLKLLYPLLDC